MALMQITVIPVGTGCTGVGNYIADIVRFLRDRVVKPSLQDMGTVSSGTSQELLELAFEVHRLPFTNGAEMVITSITLDERLHVDRKLGEKQQSVIRRLQ